MYSAIQRVQYGPYCTVALHTVSMEQVHSCRIMLLPFSPTGDPRTLFRGNSLASKSFDQFMKVVALPYLHETLSSSIEAVFSDHKLCELDVEQLKQASR